MTSAPLIDVRGVTRRFPQGRHAVPAVTGIDLSVARGDFVVLAGPSGSGKSTLLHLMAGLDEPDEGEVHFDGAPLTTRDEAARAALRRSGIGIVFQAFNLIPVLSAFENVEYGSWLNGVPRAERRRRAEQALDAVGLSHRRSHRPDHLSGGERQRVAIARALINEPLVVLADEPTASLDSVTGGGIIQLLLDLNHARGTTVIIATHDPRVMAVAPRVLTMADGRLTGDARSTAVPCSP